MTTSHWQRQHPFKVSNISTDIVIVGAGYVGLSTAFWLTEIRPHLKITILDRGSCGSGASGRNAGFLTMGSASFYKSLCLKWGFEKAQKIHQFARESLDLVHQNILNSSPEIKYEKTASMTLFQNEDQLKTWQSSSFGPSAFEFNWIDNPSMPESLQSKFYGGYEIGPEYKVNPVQLLATLKNLLESRKVQIIENSSAFEVVAEGIRTEMDTIRARQVVLAMNGYFPQFHQNFKDVIVPQRAQMLAVEFEETLNCPHLYYDPPERVYWRKIQDKVLVIGGKRLLDEAGETGDFEKISPVIQKGLDQYLKEQLGLKYKVINRWSGTMGFTEHELPLAGKVTAPVETFMIGGFSGHGMGLGFRSARDIAELVVGTNKESFFEQFKKVEFTL